MKTMPHQGAAKDVVVDITGGKAATRSPMPKVLNDGDSPLLENSDTRNQSCLNCRPCTVSI